MKIVNPTVQQRAKSPATKAKIKVDVNMALTRKLSQSYAFLLVMVRTTLVFGRSLIDFADGVGQWWKYIGCHFGLCISKAKQQCGCGRFELKLGRSTFNIKRRHIIQCSGGICSHGPKETSFCGESTTAEAQNDRSIPMSKDERRRDPFTPTWRGRHSDRAW